MAIQLSVNIQDRDVTALMENLRDIDRGGYHGALKAIGEAAKAMSVESFEEGKSPAGDEWKVSARAEEESGQTLVDNAVLKNSIGVAVSGDEAMVGTNVIYAAIHQLGGVIKPKSAKALQFKVSGGFVVVKKVEIPPRPYLPDAEDPPSALIDEMNHILINSIEKAVA